MKNALCVDVASLLQCANEPSQHNFTLLYILYCEQRSYMGIVHSVPKSTQDSILIVCSSITFPKTLMKCCESGGTGDPYHSFITKLKGPNTMLTLSSSSIVMTLP